MQFIFTFPKLSPTMDEGTIAKWHKKEGDFVKGGEVLLEIMTDKATVEHAALDDGFLRKILVKEGGTATINQPIAIFTENKDEPFEDVKAPKAEEKKAEMPPQGEIEPKPQKVEIPRKEPLFIPEEPLKDYSFEEFKKKKVFASPLARFIAKQKNLDLTTVKGSGPQGRILKKDLEFAKPKSFVSFGRGEMPSNVPGSYEEIPLSPIRKIIGRRLQESKSFIPHFYVRQEIDAIPLFHLREELKNLNLHLTFNDLVIRATALALREHPELNSGFNSQNQTIIQFKTIDISVAVSLKEGLITPIIRHADYKNVGEISTEMKMLGEKAKLGKLKDHEYKGGSFSVSNLGMFGISEFFAVINPPQSAILAVGGIVDKPVLKNGEVVAGKTLNLNLSVDHRVVDGVEAAKFLKTLQKILENPSSLLV